MWSYSTVLKKNIYICTHTQSHLQLDQIQWIVQIDKQVDTSLPTCVQAQICRSAHATRYIGTFSPRQTHALLSPLHLDKHTGSCFVNAILHGFLVQKKKIEKKAPTLSSDSLAWNPYSSWTWWKWGCGKDNILPFLRATTSESPWLFCHSNN